MTIEVEQLGTDEIHRVAEIDRSETVAAHYAAERLPDGRTLALRRMPYNPPRRIKAWDESDIEHRAGLWKTQLEKGGLLLGAVDGQRLLGIAVLGPGSSDDSAELCALFVDAHHRRTGIGSPLMSDVEKHAKDRGIKSLFIYANPTSSAVEFYLSRDCKIISIVDKTLVTHLPWDVVFAKEL